MGKRLAPVAQGVLPRASSKAGDKAIRSVQELLTAEQQSDLRSDLAEMARQRRKAEESSSQLQLS